MNLIKTLLKIFICCLTIFSCRREIDLQISDPGLLVSNSINSAPPNIILIVADDFGYEIPTYTGGQSYQTPNLDALAHRGIQCTQTRSSPNCSPSRVMLLSGKYNFRNYVNWGIFDTTEKTIANMLHDAGYATCVAGKWQFDGGINSIQSLGFDSHCVITPFAATAKNDEYFRYKNPHIYQDGMYLPDEQTSGKYGDDMFGDYMYEFIDSVANQPFFILYTLGLCHFPFCPTPDNPEFDAWDPALHHSDTKFFPSMVKYLDKKIGQLISKLRATGLDDRTVIMFLSDNGSPNAIKSYFNDTLINGGKDLTKETGTHVPLIVYDPQMVSNTHFNGNLIDFTDFLPTIADFAGIEVPSNYGKIDGVSFFPGLTNNSRIRDWVFCHWKPNSSSTQRFQRFVQNKEYKLYDSTNNKYFFHYSEDLFERYPISDNHLTAREFEIKRQFEQILSQMHN